MAKTKTDNPSPNPTAKPTAKEPQPKQKPPNTLIRAVTGGAPDGEKVLSHALELNPAAVNY